MSVETEISEQKPQDPIFRFAHPRTSDFLRAALEDGAVLRYLNSDPLKTNSNYRSKGTMLGITMDYFATDQPREEIGKIYYPDRPITRERVRQIIGDALRSVWSMTSGESGIKENFPFDEIPKDKPISLNYRLRVSNSNGGRMSKIIEQIESGASYKDLVDGVDPHTINQQRTKLKRLGYSVPYSEKSDPVKKAERNRKLEDRSLTFEELKEFYKSLSNSQKQAVLQNKPGEPARVISLFDSSGLAELHMRPTDVPRIRTVLSKARIAVAEYYIYQKDTQQKRYGSWIRVVDIEKAIAVLRSEPSFERYKLPSVQALCGNESELPTTTKFANEDGYRRVASVMSNVFGIHLGREVTAGEFFTKECQAPVYKCGMGVFYRTDPESERELVGFILRRKRELGI